MSIAWNELSLGLISNYDLVDKPLTLITPDGKTGNIKFLNVCGRIMVLLSEPTSEYSTPQSQSVQQVVPRQLHRPLPRELPQPRPQQDLHSSSYLISPSATSTTDWKSFFKNMDDMCEIKTPEVCISTTPAKPSAQFARPQPKQTHTQPPQLAQPQAQAQQRAQQPQLAQPRAQIQQPREQAQSRAQPPQLAQAQPRAQIQQPQAQPRAQIQQPQPQEQVQDEDDYSEDDDYYEDEDDDYSEDDYSDEDQQRL
jgi:hypothetical protein